jgi:hypothetical protein
VAVAAVDVDARQLDFRLLARGGGPKRKGRGKDGKKTTPKHHRKMTGKVVGKAERNRPRKKQQQDKRPGKHKRRGKQ